MTTEIAVRPKASQQLAALIGMDPGAMLEAIKAQCFKGNSSNITNEQLAAFVSIAADMGVNPFLPDMLYAFPGQGGSIIPIMGPSGVYKKLMEHPDVDSWETIVYPEDVALPPTHATTKIWRKGRERPLQYTALMSEWRVTQNPNWNNRPRHMLSLRSLKHCARQIIHGIPYDADDRVIMEQEINVTPGAEPEKKEETQQKRSDPPARSRKGAGAVTPPADDGKTINVETVSPKTETPPPPAQEKQAEKVAEKVAEKTAPPATVEPKTESGPRTSINENETITVKCVVKKLHFMNVNMEGVLTPSVHAIVDGEFSGPVYHFAAAKEGKDGLESNRPEWVVGNTVVLSLFGRINKKTNNVLARVDKLEAPEGQPNTAEIEV